MPGCVSVVAASCISAAGVFALCGGQQQSDKGQRHCDVSLTPTVRVATGDGSLRKRELPKEVQQSRTAAMPGRCASQCTFSTAECKQHQNSGVHEKLQESSCGEAEEESCRKLLLDGHIDILRPPLELKMPQDRSMRCVQLAADSSLHQQLVAWFKRQWQYDGKSPVGIKAIFDISNPKNYRQFHDYAHGLGKDLSPYSAHSEMPGNVNMFFHGTFLGCDFLRNQRPCGKDYCNLCSIVLKGFAMEKVSSGHGDTWYGQGFYVSPSSAVAFKFSRTARAVLGVAVACGNVSVYDNNFADSSTMKDSLGPLEADYHTRVVKNPDNSMETGVLRGARGADRGKVADEVITFRPESIHAKYLFILEDAESHDLKCANYPVCCSRAWKGKQGNFCTLKCKRLAESNQIEKW